MQSIAEEVGDREGAGCAYAILGRAYQSLDDFQRAIEYHIQHVSIAKEVGDRAGEGCAYGNIGVAYHSLKEFQRAIEYHNQHLSIAKEVITGYVKATPMAISALLITALMNSKEQ